MKFTIITLILGMLLGFQASSQNLDLSITKIANDLAQKVSKKNKVKLALTDFVNNEGKTDALTDYIREQLELKLINSDGLEVMDRKHIKRILEEHKLRSDGLINEESLKSAISFIMVDGLVMAEVISVGDKIQIKVTVTDVSTSLIYAASSSELIEDVAIRKILEEKICSECGGRGTVQVQSICTTCNGTGYIACSSCKGTGQTVMLNFGSNSYVK